MTNLLELAADLLRNHGYAVEELPQGDPAHLLFENDRTIGIVLSYENSAALLSNWARDSETLLEANQLGLRRSLEKAWNAYTVLLAEEPADTLAQARLDSIEENLIGTRKIARAGIGSNEVMARALLPLLPIQNAPNLEPVDMKAEIRIRTTQLPPALIDAFLAGRDSGTIFHILEE